MANFKQDFISRVLKAKINWPREMKIMNALVSEYPEPTFWTNLDIGFQINSLAFFRTEEGSNLLRSKYLDFKAFLTRIRNK